MIKPTPIATFTDRQYWDLMVQDLRSRFEKDNAKPLASNYTVPPTLEPMSHWKEKSSDELGVAIHLGTIPPPGTRREASEIMKLKNDYPNATMFIVKWIDNQTFMVRYFFYDQPTKKLARLDADVTEIRQGMTMGGIRAVANGGSLNQYGKYSGFLDTSSNPTPFIFLHTQIPISPGTVWTFQ